MANSYALNLYSLRLKKRYNNNIEYVLSDFGANQDLLRIIEDMFENWKFEEKKAKEDKNAIGSNEMNILKIDEEKVVRIKQNEDKSFCLNRIGRMLDGVLMYGEAGTSEPVVDIKMGNFVILKQKKMLH